jgi:heme/copper-type cytochrome/quinol oxidase subunit 2
VCGVAIDVPLIVFVAVLLVDHAEVMPTPGANQSTQSPWFENEALRSVWSVAPIVIASATRAGEKLQAFLFELPAAIA